MAEEREIIRDSDLTEQTGAKKVKKSKSMTVLLIAVALSVTATVIGIASNHSDKKVQDQGTTKEEVVVEQVEEQKIDYEKYSDIMDYLEEQKENSAKLRK